MNKDINKTLMALVPILKMNGENVTNIEAVRDWYNVGDREYMKEVAEITYDNDTVRYADIGCDSNLAAIYDVMAVIQRIKPESEAIERIERGVYSLPPAQPEQRWIPFKTRPLTKAEKEEHPEWDGILDCKLPDDGQRILVSVSVRGHESVQYDEFYTDDGSYLDSGYEIGTEATAWMSLPKPYKAESEDKE